MRRIGICPSWTDHVVNSTFFDGVIMDRTHYPLERTIRKKTSEKDAPGVLWNYRYRGCSCHYEIYSEQDLVSYITVGWFTCWFPCPPAALFTPFPSPFLIQRTPNLIQVYYERHSSNKICDKFTPSLTNIPGLLPTGGITPTNGAYFCVAPVR